MKNRKLAIKGISLQLYTHFYLIACLRTLINRHFLLCAEIFTLRNIVNFQKTLNRSEHFTDVHIEKKKHLRKFM